MRNPIRICERMEFLLGKRYQEEFSDEVLPISNKFLVPTHENMKIKFGDSYVQVINTLGHSPNHISFYEMSTKTLFSGDAIGQAYESVIPYRSIVSFPSMCSPQYFNQTLQKIRQLNSKRIAVAHFGFVKNAQNHLDQCQYFYDEYQKLLKDPKSSLKKLRE